jgi:hypothetical protein
MARQWCCSASTVFVLSHVDRALTGMQLSQAEYQHLNQKASQRALQLEEAINAHQVCCFDKAGNFRIHAHQGALSCRAEHTHPPSSSPTSAIRARDLTPDLQAATWCSSMHWCQTPRAACVEHCHRIAMRSSAAATAAGNAIVEGPLSVLSCAHQL